MAAFTRLIGFQPAYIKDRGLQGGQHRLHLVFISEKHISGTYFGENLIDIRGGADVDPLVAPDLLYTRVGIQLIW
jgi:hypothetical protein